MSTARGHLPKYTESHESHECRTKFAPDNQHRSNLRQTRNVVRALYPSPRLSAATNEYDFAGGSRKKMATNRVKITACSRSSPRHTSSIHTHIITITTASIALVGHRDASLPCTLPLFIIIAHPSMRNKNNSREIGMQSGFFFSFVGDC